MVAIVHVHAFLHNNLAIATGTLFLQDLFQPEQASTGMVTSLALP